MKKITTYVLFGIIGLMIIIIHDSVYTQEISVAKKNEYYKQNYSEKFDQGTKKKYRNKRRARKVKLVSATPKLDSIFGRAKKNPISVEAQNSAIAEIPQQKSSTIPLLAAIVLALATTGGGFFYYMKSLAQHSKNFLQPVIVEPPVVSMPVISVAPQPSTAEMPALPVEFYTKQSDESELLVEKFQKSQQELELETTLFSSPKIESFKNISAKGIGKSMKRRIASAKKLGVGVGELMLYQRLNSFEKETVKEMAQ